MKITVLGSGSAIQYQNRASASFLVEYNHKKILLDAGFYLLDRLEKINVMADEIDAVYISHPHPDHCMGLFHMLFALKNKYYKPKKEIFIFGFNGIEKWFNSFKEILGGWIEPESKLIFSDEKSGNIFGIDWEIFDTKHKEDSTGIILRADKYKITYSGDTEYFDELSKLADGSDLFIAECGSGNLNKNKGHMSIDDIRHAAHVSCIKNILLTHIYPETDKMPKSWSENGSYFMQSFDLQQIDLSLP
jgi:ribonuclease BN (tRNA processing enzyme)